MKFRVNPEFKIEKFDNETLLYAVSSTNGIYLNETACLVWELCMNNNSVEAIVALLEETYPEQGDTLAQDIKDTIMSLIDSKVLIVEND